MSVNNVHPYDDIIDLPHPVSKKHPPMSLSDRAAQFSPFSALTGYDKALGETAELARERVEEEVVKVREDGELILKREYE